MIKMIKISSLLVLAILLNSCASGYKKINPETINYASKSIESNILFEYKYDLLEKKSLSTD
jgi:PBP1b-binding outer membrane lipoprotein LpoB